MRTIRVFTAVAFAAALAGCSSHAAGTTDGGGGGSSVTSPVDEGTPTTWASPAMSIEDITKQLGLTDYQPNVQVFTTDIAGRSEPLICNIAVVMNTKENVAMYAEAGDNVAMNRAKTIGVKFAGGALGDKPDDIPACGMALNEALQGLS